MSAVPSVIAQSPAPEGKPPVRLPRVRQDLKLYPGPQHRDGSPSWRILDPVRNRFFEIGWLEFELLARWAPGLLERDHATVEAWADTVVPSRSWSLSFSRPH